MVWPGPTVLMQATVSRLQALSQTRATAPGVEAAPKPGVEVAPNSGVDVALGSDGVAVAPNAGALPKLKPGVCISDGATGRVGGAT